MNVGQKVRTTRWIEDIRDPDVPLIPKEMIGVVVSVSEDKRWVRFDNIIGNEDDRYNPFACPIDALEPVTEADQIVANVTAIDPALGACLAAQQELMDFLKPDPKMIDFLDKETS